MTKQTTTETKSLTIPAREVRPGDVLFGHEVQRADGPDWQEHIGIDLHPDLILWMPRDQNVTVERPVPSDPIGTVRAEFADGIPRHLFQKAHGTSWFSPGLDRDYTDTDVARLPILWKPGMPIPSVED